MRFKPYSGCGCRGESGQSFKNVPSCVRGKSFFSLKGSSAESGTWMIEYCPPTQIFATWLI